MDWVALLLKIAPVAMTGALGVVGIGRETVDPTTKKLTRFGVTTRIAIVLMTLLAITSQVLDAVAGRRSAAAVESRMQTQEHLQRRTLDTITEAASSTPASLQVDLSFEGTPSARTAHSSRLQYRPALRATSMRRLVLHPNAASMVERRSIRLSGFLKDRRKVELHSYPGAVSVFATTRSIERVLLIFSRTLDPDMVLELLPSQAPSVTTAPPPLVTFDIAPSTVTFTSLVPRITYESGGIVSYTALATARIDVVVIAAEHSRIVPSVRINEVTLRSPTRRYMRITALEARDCTSTIDSLPVRFSNVWWDSDSQYLTRECFSATASSWREQARKIAWVGGG